MKVYTVSIWILIFLCLTTFALSFHLHLLEIEFWSDLLLGVFASGILALITSIIFYWIERSKSIRQYYYITFSLIKSIRSDSIIVNSRSFRVTEIFRVIKDLLMEYSKYNDCDLHFFCPNGKIAKLIYDIEADRIEIYDKLWSDKSKIEFYLLQGIKDYDIKKYGALMIWDDEINNTYAALSNRLEKIRSCYLQHYRMCYILKRLFKK